MAPKIRRRSRLRRKETTDFLGRLGDEFGMEVPLDDVPLDEAEAGPHRLLLRGNDAIAIFLDGSTAPTIRSLLAFPAKKRSVTVDMGAVRFIGRPIEVIYGERCGLAGDELIMAVREFQRVEAESVHEGMRAYPGIREALASLAAWKLAAVTNKRHDTSVEALRVTGLLPFFVVVLGGDSVPRKNPAPDPILRAASGLGVEPPECVVGGHTEKDGSARTVAGARTIGVTWGYGTRARLEAAGVDYLIETPEALPPLLRALTPSTAA